MIGSDDLRHGERKVIVPSAFDAGVFFIGVIRTPWSDRRACPRRGAADGPICRLLVDETWWAALDGIEVHGSLEILYWMHLARRDLVHQNPKRRGDTFGTFAIRSPVRPNPIASSIVTLIGVEPGVLRVRGLDCVDGTPLIDIKPARCPAINPDDDR